MIEFRVSVQTASGLKKIQFSKQPCNLFFHHRDQTWSFLAVDSPEGRYNQPMVNCTTWLRVQL